MGVKRLKMLMGPGNLPTSKVLFSPPKVRAQSREVPPPALAQRDLLVGSGCSDLQAGVPHPPGPRPRGRSGSRARRSCPSATAHTPRSTYLSPVVVNQLDHLLHHILAHLAVNVSLCGGWVLLLKGQEKNTATQSLASPPGPAPLKGGHSQEALASPRSHFLLLSKQGVTSSSCLSPGPCCSCTVGNPALSLMLHLPPKTRKRSRNCPPTLERCPFNICLVPVTSSFSIHSGEMNEAAGTEDPLFYYLEDSFKPI